MSKRRRKAEQLPDWIDAGMDRLHDQPERAARLREARLWLWREMQRAGQAE